MSGIKLQGDQGELVSLQYQTSPCYELKKKFKDGTSVPGGGGVWFPAHSNVTCTGKGVKILSTNQLTRIDTYDDFIG